ncbi:MAG TPA: helix-turn-helix transcriptional regulator [Lamprocystis sp. (in: g-proteobacteria)]|nr:helix-turn-helix transcriptional regulator [Lamprocystis sp. (in: g-proteobacteria)]
MTTPEPVSINLDLLEQIHDVTLARSSWREVLDRLTLEFSTEEPLLVVYGTRPEQARSLVTIGPGGRPWSEYTEHFAAIDPFAAAMRTGGVPPGTIVSGDDIVPARQFCASEYFNDWFKPNGIRHTAGGFLPTRDGVLIQLGMPRAAGAGHYAPEEIARLQRYFNHIGRAILAQEEIASRLAQPDYDEVARTYGLTPAEARLIEALTQHGSLRRSAQITHRSYHTLRAHLRSVLVKTGAHSQIELMRLIHRGLSGLQEPKARGLTDT